MNAQTIINLVSYVTVGLVLVVGIMSVTGYLIPEYVPDNFRLMMGIVLVLYSVYRIATIWTKQRNARRMEKE